MPPSPTPQACRGPPRDRTPPAGSQEPGVRGSHQVGPVGDILARGDDTSNGAPEPE